jgi:HD-GYP domain-containing protein (c-di-GMP phosphodiesterase class II)
MAAFTQNRWEVLGVIQLMNAIDPDTGDVGTYAGIDEQPVIYALAKVAANTLSNLVHVREIRKLFQSFVSAMVRTIDERSKYNSNHTTKVASLCNAFACYLRDKFAPGHIYHFNEWRLEELTMAAMLHDIGKVVTPMHIMDKADRLGDRLALVRNKFTINMLLNENAHLKGEMETDEYNERTAQLKKALALVLDANSGGYTSDEKFNEIQKLATMSYTPQNEEPVYLLEKCDLVALSVRKGTLTDEERHIMQEHANTTGRILSNIGFEKYYANVTDWAQSHHELLDGSGYPQGLKGDQLMVEVLIITIMDIFEALTASDRPYKKAMKPDAAFRILGEMADEGKLHAGLVELFKESEVWKEVML